MDIVKDAALGAGLLAVQAGTALPDSLVGILPHNMRDLGEMLAWFLLYVVLRLRDSVRVTRRVRSHVRRLKSLSTPPDATPPPK